jgi:hypothetical protein
MVDSFVQKTDDPSSPVGFAAARRKQMSDDPPSLCELRRGKQRAVLSLWKFI